ncbi:MAG TPA: GNAT family N-acetyltransferase [Acidimicrobiales bacterium]|nr:GNAT family N-acetyltransferase [Acidimicrobiales bacterium]
MIKVEVRPADAADLEKLVARESQPAKQIYERERFAAQERGDCALLVAWDGDVIHGRVRLRWYSKYVEIIDEFGEFPEINALDAWPTGEGVGTQIVEACERIASARGETQVGIGVEVSNTAARRLYERLGYRYWGDVIDEWGEVDAEGNVTFMHHDPAAYLIKTIP